VVHVRYSHCKAEPGRIEGGEDGVSATADLGPLLTTPEEARTFVETGIEMLAPALGNVHGNYGPRGIQLEYDRLEAINREVGNDVRLVLHGADPFTADTFERCVKASVCKININKGHEQSLYAGAGRYEGTAIDQGHRGWHRGNATGHRRVHADDGLGQQGVDSGQRR
jgi:fructose-bisphosphate aldolase, class II